MLRTAGRVVDLASRVRAKFSRIHYSVRVQHHQRVRDGFNKKIRTRFPAWARDQQLYKARNMTDYGERVKYIFRSLVPKGAMLNFRTFQEAAEIDSADSKIEHRSEDGILHVSVMAPKKSGHGHVVLEFDLDLMFFTQSPSDAGLQTIEAIRNTLLQTLETAARNWE